MKSPKSANPDPNSLTKTQHPPLVDHSRGFRCDETPLDVNVQEQNAAGGRAFQFKVGMDEDEGIFLSQDWVKR